jgi:hypothetical protein
MMGGDHGGGKLVKSLRGAAQKYVGVAFFLGFFLVLLTYFTLSEQFAIAAPNGEFFGMNSGRFCNCSAMFFFACFIGASKHNSPQKQ